MILYLLPKHQHSLDRLLPTGNDAPSLPVRKIAIDARIWAFLVLLPHNLIQTKFPYEKSCLNKITIATQPRPCFHSLLKTIYQRFAARPNVYQPNCGLVLTITLEFLASVDNLAK
jgi:hypothetical protein